MHWYFNMAQFVTPVPIRVRVERTNMFFKALFVIFTPPPLPIHQKNPGPPLRDSNCRNLWLSIQHFKTNAVSFIPFIIRQYAKSIIYTVCFSLVALGFTCADQSRECRLVLLRHPDHCYIENNYKQCCETCNILRSNEPGKVFDI